MNKPACSARKLACYIIHQAIKDIAAGDEKEFISAKIYIDSAMFIDDCRTSGYPLELLDTLQELMLVSTTERKFLLHRILALLTEYQEINSPKKTPLN